ncbi:MAG: carboxypeptidase-like regulatory domain-containing protein [Isosphaeraceae bacterium]
MIASLGFEVFTILAALVTAQAPLTGSVVDAQGKPVPGAEVALSAGMTREGTVPSIAETRTDEAGRFSFSREKLRSRPQIRSLGAIWAHKPGLGLGLVDLLRNDQPATVHRVVLEAAAVRTITLKDAEGKPLAGLRLAPRLVVTEGSRYDGVLIPDAWLDRLSATTDARGSAPLPFLTSSLDLRTILVSRPDVARHVLSLPYSAGKENATLILGPPARLAGRISTSVGKVPATAAITIWARCAMAARGSRTVKGLPEPVRLKSGPIRVSQDGTFETPEVLMNGATYRIAVRSEGFAPALSDWVKLDGRTAEPVSITLQPFITIKGRVVDRQGQPVAGARVVQAGGGSESETDPAGRFVLDRTRPGRSFLIARKLRFRVHGLEVDGKASTSIELTLSRESGPAQPRMATLPAPISLDESRQLARKILEPLLPDATARGDDAAKLWLLRIERWLDPPGLLEEIEKTKFTRPTTADYLKGQAALGLNAADPEEAAAVAETISDPSYKAGTLVDLVDELPPSELTRKRAFLDRAAAQARLATLNSNKFFQMGEVAERWLELGDKDKALALFGEGRTLVGALPPATRTEAGSFLAHLSRVDPKSPIELVQGVGTDRWNQRVLANIASRLALEHPAEAEQALRLLHEPVWRLFAGLRVCRRLARSDPDRARRIAADLPNPRERAYAWTFLADGLVDVDPAGARAALDRAIHGLDDDAANRASGSPEPCPSASILPLCERIAPERVSEIFWRAVAEQPAGDDPRDDFGGDHALVENALLLARYDRTVAATLFAPVAAYIRSAPSRWDYDMTPTTVLALACIDPRNAAAVIERLPRSSSLDINEPTNWAIQTLAEHLALPPDRRWLSIWRFHAGCGIAMFEDVYRDL